MGSKSVYTAYCRHDVHLQQEVPQATHAALCTLNHTAGLTVSLSIFSSHFLCEKNFSSELTGEFVTLLGNWLPV